MSETKPWLAVYQEVGETLHAWSIVETELTHLFMAMHAQPWNDFVHPLRAAFEAVISLEARLGMIGATAGADKQLNDRYPAHFQPLKVKLLKSYRKRHEVAHFTLVGRADATRQVHLIRPFFNWAKFQANEGVELDLKQIRERKEAFFRLSERVLQHRQYVARRKELPAEYYAEAGHLVYPDLDDEPTATN